MNEPISPIRIDGRLYARASKMLLNRVAQKIIHEQEMTEDEWSYVADVLESYGAIVWTSHRKRCEAVKELRRIEE